MSSLDNISKNGFIEDHIDSYTTHAYISDISAKNPADVLDVLSLACHTIGGPVCGVNCSALGRGFDQAGGGLFVVSAISNSFRLVDECLAFDYSPKAVVNLSERLAKTVRDTAKTVSFFEAVEAIREAPMWTKWVGESASGLSSLIGFGKNVSFLSEAKVNNSYDNACWWQNACEASANILAVALSVIALLGLVFAEAVVLGITTAFLVCVFASHVFAKDAEQIGFVNHLQV